MYILVTDSRVHNNAVSEQFLCWKNTFTCGDSRALDLTCATLPILEFHFCGGF